MNKINVKKESITDRITRTTEERKEQVMGMYLDTEEKPMDIINYYLEMAKTGRTGKEQ